MNKKIIIIVVTTIVVLLGLILVIPIFFKDNIIKMVEKQSSSYIDANLIIGDVDMSLFKNFPNLNVKLKDVILTGKGEFESDTLAKVPLFELSVNAKSLIFGKEIIVNKMLMKDAGLYLSTNIAGKSNFDIVIDNSATVAANSSVEKGSDVNVKLNGISVENLKVIYSDYKSSNYASVASVNMGVSGNFSEENSNINIDIDLNNISYRTGNSVLLNNCTLRWNSVIAANMKDRVFSIVKNDLLLNDLALNLTGILKVTGDERYNIDMELNAPDTKFESLLALVPKDFQKHIEGLKATGEFNLALKAKGDYYENNLPAINAEFAVKEARVKYSEQPEAIENINIDLKVTNPGGAVDLTVIDLKRMSFMVAKNPFSMFAKVVNVKDPEISGGAIGIINFENLKKALPLRDMTLKGVVTTDITFNGKYKYIEREEYEKFTAKGTISLKDILFINKDYPKGITVESGKVAVTPAKLNLNNLKVKIFSSDFALQGYISNYLPYIFKNETLKGNFSINSTRVNLNEFMVSSNDTKGTATETAGALEVPKNIDMYLSTNITTMLFDDLNISRVRGDVRIAGGVASLSNLTMNMLDGEMVMTGNYNSVNPKVPTVKFDLNITNFNLNSMYHSFSMVKKSLPMAMNCEGKISSKMNFTAALDKNMDPIMTTLNGAGMIDSRGILISGVTAMDQLSQFIKKEELSRLSISKLKVDFNIVNGNITVEPFTTTLAGNPLTIYGKQSVDGNLDYVMSVNVKREMFGGDVNKLLSSVPGSSNIKALDIDLTVKGTLDKPIIKPDLSKAIKAVTKEAEKDLLKKAKDGILKGLGF